MARLSDYRQPLTPAEKRLIQELKEHGCAICEFNANSRYWTWKLNGRPVTGPLYRLAAKGKVEIETPTPGAKAFLKAA